MAQFKDPTLSSGLIQSALSQLNSIKSALIPLGSGSNLNANLYGNSALSTSYATSIPATYSTHPINLAESKLWLEYDDGNFLAGPPLSIQNEVNAYSMVWTGPVPKTGHISACLIWTPIKGYDQKVFEYYVVHGDSFTFTYRMQL